MKAEVALAFSAGLLSPVSPCGFAMLPAYLSYFLAGEGGPESGASERLWHGLVAGVLVTAGFGAIYAVVGGVFAFGLRGIVRVMPWLAIAIGVVLFIVGVGFVLGVRAGITLPEIFRPGRSRGPIGMFLFGLAYAVASLSCTLAAFLAVVGATLTVGGTGLPILFAAYTAGSAAVILAVSISASLANEAVTRNLKKALPLIHRVSGALLVVAGAYIVLYWYLALTAASTDSPLRTPIHAVEKVQGAAGEWLVSYNGSVAGFVVLVAASGLAAWLYSRRSRRSAADSEDPILTSGPTD